VLVHLHSQDFSFVGEAPMAKLYEIFAQLNIKPNLIQTGAISLQIGLDDRPEKIEQFAAAASTIFDVQVEKGLQLLTIRHYTSEVLNKLMLDKEIILEQKTKETIQVLFK
jgi:aspartate kinase